MALLFLFIFAVLVLLVWNKVRQRPTPIAQDIGLSFPFEHAGPLFSPAERSFLGVLEQSVGAELRVLGKVRLADLIRPSAGLATGPRNAAFNKISRKHVDFVLCDPHTLAVVAVVELDDRSHQRADRRERNTFVDEALAAAGIPILHMPCQRAYSVSELRESVLSKIGRTHFGSTRLGAHARDPLRLIS